MSPTEPHGVTSDPATRVSGGGAVVIGGRRAERSLGNNSWFAVLLAVVRCVCTEEAIIVRSAGDTVVSPVRSITAVGERPLGSTFQPPPTCLPLIDASLTLSALRLYYRILFLFVVLHGRSALHHRPGTAQHER